LLPGECLTIEQGRASKVSYWDPLDIARASVVENTDEAAAVLRTAVKTSVHTWAACHDSILLYLSGGLDSSIVLASLYDAPKRPHVTCLTEYSPGADSDEREYARLMTQHVGFCAQIEQLRNSDIPLQAMLNARLTPSPQGTHRRVEAARREAQLAHRCGASAVFSGSGGDQLFFQNSARLSVADFLVRRGVRIPLARLIYQAAQLEKKSVWRISRDALANALSPERFDPLTSIFEGQTLVSAGTEDCISTARAARRAQRRRRPHIPPGKLWHAYDVAPADCYYDPFGESGDPEQIAPLLSQPLIETVLQIPTYLLLADGWERGLARRAFEAELPPAIARRRGKGGIEEHLFDILQKNKEFARSLLVDGVLADRGLIDRDRVASALSDGPSGVLKGSAEIYVYLATEAWLRMWGRQASRAAA
jgi:asparagine synthase (glutamine-hydrolysing)